MSISALAAGYAARGWRLVRLYGVVSPGHCSCRKGRDCPSPGKHPVGEAWHLSATSDEEEVALWYERDAHVNIGLLLGPGSGVIDVELDGPDAAAAWQELGLGEIWTPTYTAGRGPHRLFKWSEDLPAVAVKKVSGIEVRIGNGGMAAQSVIPPSTHHTGVTYQWVPGMSPDDVELAELPDRLKALVWNDDGTGTRITRREPASAPLRRAVGEGKRNSELHRFAVAEAFRATNLDSEYEQQDLLLKVRAVNAVACKPPLDDAEVVQLYRSAIAFCRKTRAAGMDASAALAAAETAALATPGAPAAAKQSALKGEWKTFTEIGLSFSPRTPDSDPEWEPGEWTLIVNHADPIEYRLVVPAWAHYLAAEQRGLGSISLTVDQYLSAAKVARAVLAATGVVMLDAEPGKWRRIWEGGYKVEDGKNTATPVKRVARGVKAKLLDNPAHEWPGASSLRYSLLATYLYDRLSQASPPGEDDAPDSTGRATWRADGTLWFGWGKLWEDISRQHRLEDGERLGFKRRMLCHMPGHSDFRHAEYRHPGGSRRSYVVWTRQEMAVLERLANAAAEVPPTT